VASVFNTKLIKLKLFLIVVLLSVTGLLIYQSGFGLTSTLLSIACVAVILCCFRWQSRPKEEQSCAAVSCCHYLWDRKDNHT
jgi:hypothetical protein